jgi:hypothetical protein
MQVVPPLLKLMPPSVPGEFESIEIALPMSWIGLMAFRGCVEALPRGIWVAQ